MIENEKLDLITVATPNGLHKQHVMQIAKHKIHVITEKPMAIKYSDGLEMVKEADKNGIELFVIHQNRFNDTCQEIKNAYNQGRFGKIYLITSNVFWTRPQEYYDKDGDWHGSKELDGGAFYTQASHYIDFIEWITNSEPKSVYANLKTLARNIETEDTGIANIEWQNGILGSVNMTMLTFPKNLEGSVTILGEKGTVKLGGVAMNKIEHWQFSDRTEKDDKIMNANYETSSVYGFGHVRYYDNVVKVLRGNETPLIDGIQGLKSLKLLEAIIKSSNENMPIHFENILEDENV